MPDICAEKHRQIDKQFDVDSARLNNHSERIDSIEQKLVAQAKDTSHLQEALRALKASIDTLILEIGNMKAKPLEKYDKIAMVVVTAIISSTIGFIISQLFIGGM